MEQTERVELTADRVIEAQRVVWNLEDRLERGGFSRHDRCRLTREIQMQYMRVTSLECVYDRERSFLETLCKLYAGPSGT